MAREKTLSDIRETGIVAIIRGLDTDTAAAAAQALYQAGIKAIEVTCNSPEAVNTIRFLKQMFGNELSIGAGTVLDIAKAKEVTAAGAEFVLAPDCNIEVIKWVKDNGRVMVPGAFTATEILRASRAGADIVKVFPASIAGPEYIKDLQGPLPGIAYMPVGGVTLANTAAFIRAGSYAVGIGSQMLRKEYIINQDYAAVSELAKEYMRMIKNARG